MELEVISLSEYMEKKRKVIDRYVEGEHKWFGDIDTSTLTESLSYNPNPIPWYIK